MEDWRLILMVGLPRAGKTTRARQLAKELPAPIVNTDAIREVLHGHRRLDDDEDRVWNIARVMVHALFRAGHDCVILDATNTSARSRAMWESGPWRVQYEVIGTSAAVCIDRARCDGHAELVPIIECMAAEYELVTR